ncbi:acetyl-CoA carboxylase biotin carboxyl carrier protein [Coxiella endosymbiont of Amblyomma nuttalli]|uniref:acetyl-CoA carboxylase biotin carboxyl carrier protein n=1 Tax=Coxiella endosymbiont of Amblyomma nuttalli TaxID=2749996 RepID=UPI001BABCBE8|nr:acetyl-CoA carboxylase biotin carboxyl carrier protein [Coxiella endosymbiont of Amblyomma nuttalli]QTS83724.1 Biotin carboxyl carrier protein of acetyl-CoA carboxylase [Coxiella endosymbiont of Amblyomma nuttalli]
MDIRKIRKLIELINETDVEEIEIKSGEESVRISRYSTQMSPSLPSSVTEQTSPKISTTINEPSHVKRESIKEGHALRSPMVGTVYLAPSPEAKPFVDVGQHVSVGDTLCLIEAMKMFNRIEADKNGVISACLIENEQPVEFDQLLFIIEPKE